MARFVRLKTAPPSPFSVSNARRYEQGAELAIISAPAPITISSGSSSTDHQQVYVQGTAVCLFGRSPSAANLYVGEVDRGILMLRIDRNGKVHDQKKEATSKGERLTSPYATRMLQAAFSPALNWL